MILGPELTPGEAVEQPEMRMRSSSSIAIILRRFIGLIKFVGTTFELWDGSMDRSGGSRCGTLGGRCGDGTG